MVRLHSRGALARGTTLIRTNKKRPTGVCWFLGAPSLRTTHVGVVFTVALRRTYIFRLSYAARLAGDQTRRLYVTSLTLSHNKIFVNQKDEIRRAR